MRDKNSGFVAKAYSASSEVSHGIWPWVSKRKARESCFNIIVKHKEELIKAEVEEQQKRDLKESGEKLHKYKVTIGYENFPWYCEVVQRGDWYLFCDGRKVMTIRHKDEKLDHTIHYREKVIEASDCYEAFKKVERNSKFHICSLEFEKLPADGK
ncbi:MAG: hypothetical protein U9N61_02170 [Euryarchaeota archaeon]|nr:hypothetical protein [Euryarchaeota archaeon]